jgi:hypothetical protein
MMARVNWCDCWASAVDTKHLKLGLNGIEFVYIPLLLLIDQSQGCRTCHCANTVFVSNGNIQ